jgi:linalool dehydratase/isomerase-like protein
MIDLSHIGGPAGGIDGTPAHGPVTTSRLRRSLVTYLAMLVIGAALPWTGSPFWMAFGVGLWFPGAGFLAAGSWWAALAPLVVILFVLSLVAWFAAGFTTLPPFVWLGSAVLAGWAAAGQPESIPGLIIAGSLVLIGFVAMQLLSRRSRRSAMRRRAERLQYLPKAIAVARETAATPPGADQLELDPDMLAGLRYVIDRGLRESGDFAGYDKIDQFQTAALRYQINYLGYALAVTQAHYTPNFHGYLTRAQRGLIDTYRDRQVWSYWAWENAWGNLRLNSDPVGRDNIMLTGFFGLQVGLYTALTGDDRYLRAGGLSFGKHQHTLHDIADSLMINFRKAPFGLFPCEPNWTYTACNFRGMGALQVYDRITGSRYFDEIAEMFKHRLETEFVHPDFAMVSLKSKHTGIDLPFPLPDAIPAVYLNSMFPDIAMRYWAILRTEAFAEEGGRLKPVLPKGAIDMGNYKPGYGLAMESLYGAAREFGDSDAAAAAKLALDCLCDPITEQGVFRYRRMSNSVNACVTIDRQLHHNFWRRTVSEPTRESALSGPILDEVAYPEVLVARATSGGDDLYLVLHPGRKSSSQLLRLARLQPNRRYRVTGATTESLVADPQGRAEVTVALNGRSEIRVQPL